MKEYYKNPNATEAFFYTDKNGTIWGRTGDLGYVDEDDNVFILGRITDSTVLENGKRIYFFDTEDIILEDSDVNSCKVVDVKKNGDIFLVAHLILCQTAAKTTTDILNRVHQYCMKKLPPCSVPTAYKIQASFPIHENGKRDIDSMKSDIQNWIYPNLD